MQHLSTLNKTGFSLIELLVVISIVSIVLTGATNILVSLLKHQSKNMNRAYLADALSYANDYMGRAIRMAKMDEGGICIEPGKSFSQNNISHIKFLNAEQECQEFFTENGMLKVKKGNVAHSLLPSNITIENLSFYLQGASSNDDKQPRVTIAIKSTVKSIAGEEKLNIQTTISKRDLGD